MQIAVGLGLGLSFDASAARHPGARFDLLACKRHWRSLWVGVVANSGSFHAAGKEVMIKCVRFQSVFLFKKIMCFVVDTDPIGCEFATCQSVAKGRSGM